jgi:threonine/homoserine/homoserine lactone efflux protein
MDGVSMMGLLPLLIFAATVGVGTAIPGPTIVTLVARVLTTGRARNMPFLLGLIAGDVIWLACAVFGLAALAAWAHDVMVVLKYAGAAYLVFLAVKLWTAPTTLPAETVAGGNGAWRDAVGGISVALANPKTMLFYLALMPNLLDMRQVGVFAFAELSLVIVVVYGTVLAFYTAMAERARSFFTSRRRMRLMNRGCGAVMAGTAAVVVTRS